MKKLVFAFMLMLGMGLTSCGGGSEANTETVDTVEVADSAETDSITILEGYAVTVDGDTIPVDSIL